ncbi:NS7c protein [Wigeon coronavirus HKU20]|uniref:NS7c protein n=1 Tax=Wigeon coronavirus HKU20 TaxID=1159908 RepID=H9BR32_9NIDO|nr:NS7c protein [Wigeon coronavirus HKU20]AFD29241.1 NS7c protein [Wigeon coronavirus HKU20]
MNLFVDLARLWLELFDHNPPQVAIYIVAAFFFLVPLHLLTLSVYPERLFFGQSECVRCDVVLSILETLLIAAVFFLLSLVSNYISILG